MNGILTIRNATSKFLEQKVQDCYINLPRLCHKIFLNFLISSKLYLMSMCLEKNSNILKDCC